MVYNFDFNIDTSGMMRVSIMKLGLIFNKNTIKALNWAKSVNIGLDKENKLLAIKPAKNDFEYKVFDFVKEGTEKWIRVNCRLIIKEIEKITNIKYNGFAISYPTKYDEQNKMLIVNLKGE